MSGVDHDRARAEAWMAVDPDPATRAEVAALLEADDHRGLADRFDASLRFGTAGLRGPLGAGPNRMNRVVVRQAAEGLVRHLLRTAPEAPLVVVIGFDARRNSDLFAADTAAIVAAHGGRAVLFDTFVPTPVLAYAVRALGASAGVMVTASHNPPADNGYKVYLADGAQLVPPSDTEIEAEIDGVGLPPLELPGPAGGGLVERVGRDLIDRYVTAAVGAVAQPVGEPLRVVYTPMHGVGRDVLLDVFAAAGLPAPAVVAAQGEPDPAFPTVSFPNPEEPGAMDLALELAEHLDADLVLANDPDADRLAVAVPDRDGGWRSLSGNEIGVLLGDRLLQLAQADDSIERPLVVNSIVSSRQLRSLALGRGAFHKEALTGFKWIGRIGYEDPDLTFVFGYEEALGYAVTRLVRDKDGITAALAFVEAAQHLASRDATVLDRLDELAVETGVHLTGQVTMRFDDVAQAVAIVERVRRDVPGHLGRFEVLAYTDFEDPPAGWPPSDLLVFDLSDGGRILLRPSGTEPKLKCYLEVVAPVATADELAAARRGAAQAMSALEDAVRELLS